jgi:hypothetical protein
LVLNITITNINLEIGTFMAKSTDNNYYKSIPSASANIQDLKKVAKPEQQSSQWKKKS